MRPAERVLTCLHLPAAEVPCKTAPFASFSGRAEKEGPARPERVPIYSLIKTIRKSKLNAKILRNGSFGGIQAYYFNCVIVMQVSLTQLHSLCSMQRERSKRNTRGGVSPTTPAHGASAAAS